MKEIQISPVPDLHLADYIFILLNDKHLERQKEAIESLLSAIKEGKLSFLYLYLHERFKNFPFDIAIYNDLKAENDKELEKFDNEIKEIQEMDGDQKIADILRRKAEFFARICDKDRALESYQEAYNNNTAIGFQIDILFGIMRIALFFSDIPLFIRNMDKAKNLVDNGADWDRKNRLKTYMALHFMNIRNFKEASRLFLDSISTFTSTELMEYEDVVKYTIITGSISLERVEFKQKIVDSPELLSVVITDKLFVSLKNMVNSLYYCNYALFFRALAEVEENYLRINRYLFLHADYYVREMKRKSYAQLLESYKALSITSMASAFGVSAEFIDKDLSRFIANKQLNCIIDRVNGIIETNRPDSKNAQYQLLIKQGDHLLNKLQKFQARIMAGM
ncbi:unnamed protein product [Pneumocystis jirovecii]|uniref:PCI domain-containing protein n=2 Tax=Pneumocystis jirovecii TaxID=42068 RepID=L0PC62_PNEJI|nr:proteasome regulatory particle lid subunit RPN7 [Pneumocystis jirovecii RU7]KTW31914.1 hypothetical protein T551_01175 [Pneumocystis jirovecii RU7]CCJ29694.1 unnamed protein product [Pneumocystis jirovecii]